MKHRRARRRLASLLEGGLAPAETVRIRAHAATCARCARVYRELRLCDALLRRLPPELTPEVWDLRAEARLRGAAQADRAVRGSAQDLLAARALGAVAAVVLVLFLTTLGPWAVSRREPRTGRQPVFLATAERQAMLVAASFERPSSWARN